jgi:hypothetical protein
MSSQPSVGAEAEKASISHIEADSKTDPQTELNDMIGFQTDEANLPPGYYRSAFFLGTLAAVSIGFFAGAAGFSLLAPILLTVNADIGPVCLSCLRRGWTPIC